MLERVKFLAITASNLDEFIEVRVAGLLQQAEHGNQLAGPDGLSPEEQLQRLAGNLHAFVTSQYECWNQKLVPALLREGIRILPVAQLDRGGRDAMDLFFVRQVDPLLTPVTIDPSHAVQMVSVRRSHLLPPRQHPRIAFEHQGFCFSVFFLSR
ncbi:MAG: hypothetical protein WCC99_01050 [Candidatus Sulfotelmatobacter sp.]